MTARVRSLAAVAALAALVLGGCGIPDDTKVTTLGPGPSLGTSDGGDPQKVQYGREATGDKSTFVKYYLEAAAGDPDTALKRAKAFMAPNAAAAFQAQPGVRVVHLVEDPPLNNPGSDDVTLKYRVLGTLDAHGELDPVADGKVEETTLNVSDLSGKSGLFLSNAPPFLMITDDALQSFYEQRAIYFWNTEHTGLVPDVRYMPLTLPPEQAPTVILSWLINGPARWLGNAVDPLPNGTAMKGIIPANTNNTLQINLNDQAVSADDPGGLDRLRRQLQWSLRPWLPKTLELRIGRADPTSYSDSDYLTSDFAYHLAEDPERFVVYDGHIRRLSQSPNSAAPIPVVTTAENKSVVTAALSSSGPEEFAALVVADTAKKQSLRVGWAPSGSTAELAKLALPNPIGHPSWAVTPDAPNNDEIGLVSAGGALYSFSATGRHAQRVEWEGAPGGITDVAIAPDGHRVAVLAGGKLYLTVLTTGADGIQLSSDTTPVTSLQLDQITAVDWSGESWLVVAGFRPKDAATGGGRAVVMDMSLDGVQDSPRVSDNLGNERVGYLSAFPANPSMGQHSNTVSYMVGSDAYDALQTVQQIKTGNLADPVTNPPAGKEPTAPFFLR